MRKINNIYNYAIVVVIIVCFKLIPLIRFVINHYREMSLFGSTPKVTTFYLWRQLFYMNGGFAPIFVFAPVWIILFSCSKFISECNSGFIVNEIQRQNYQSLLRKRIAGIWFKSPLILLALSFLVIMVSLILPKTDVGENVMSLDKSVYFFVFSNINLVFYGTLVANIGLMINYRVKNMIVTVTLSQILFTLMAIVFNLIGVRIDAIVGGYKYQNTLDVYNSLTLSGGHSYFLSTVFIAVLCIISSLLLVYVYSNKEKAVMNFEK